MRSGLNCSTLSSNALRSLEYSVELSAKIESMLFFNTDSEIGLKREAMCELSESRLPRMRLMRLICWLNDCVSFLSTKELNSLE